MKTYHFLREIYGKIKNPVVTVGSFDGVHAGHRKILAQLRAIADRIGGETVVVTFAPHPRQIVDPKDHSLRLLNSLKEKMFLLDSVGVDNLFIVPFTLGFSRLSYEQFAREYLLEGVGAKTLVIGYNHHFGHHRRGNKEALEALQTEYDFDLFQMPQYDVDDSKVSSTTVRKLIEEGKMAQANRCLVHPYFLIGRAGKNGEVRYDEALKLLPPPAFYDVTVSNHSVVTDGKLGVTHKLQLYMPGFPYTEGSHLFIQFKDTPCQ